MTFDPSCARLPDGASWRFDAIEQDDPSRAHVLSTAGSPNELLLALRDALSRAIDLRCFRIGLEDARDRPVDRRAIVQFGVSSPLFDWFFNGRTGYRAHFRAHYACGLKFNDEIIDVVRDCLDIRIPKLVIGRHLDSDFEDRGEIQIPRAVLIDSLAPNLSKIWFCTKRIKDDGGTESLPMAVLGPKILVGADQSWAAAYHDDAHAWMDVKGAFLGEAGPYQPKNPIHRAKKLHTRGEA